VHPSGFGFSTISLTRLRPVTDQLRLHDPVLVRYHGRTSSTPEHAATVVLNLRTICFRQGSWFVIDEVIGQDDRKGLVADHRPRAQHRMPQPRASAWRT
jgi:hypothetical protein